MNFRDFLDVVHLGLGQGSLGQSHQPDLLEHARHAFDRIGRWQLGARSRLELAQAASADKDARFEGAGRSLYAWTAPSSRSDFIETIGERGQPLVELLAQARDFAVVLRQRFLPPGVCHRGQQRNQRQWTGQKHSLLEPVLNQRQVVLQRCAKQ